jgi:DASS family divalent anion:Na+ symporter
MSYTKVTGYYLENDPYKKNLSPNDRAHLISTFQIIELQPDELLYNQKTATNYIYFLTHGCLTLQTADNKVITIKPGEYFGEEAALGLHAYMSKAVARESCHLIQISAHDFQQVLEKEVLIHNDLVATYSKKFIDSQLAVQKADNPSVKPTRPSLLSDELCWILSIIIPLFFYILFKDFFAEQNTRLFLTFSVSAFCLWAFSLTPVYIPPLIIVVSSLVLECAPKTTIFSGFASENFLMLFSILALSRAIAASNILYRIMLKILKFMPPTHFWTNTSVFILGILLTPLVPLSRTRQDLFKKFTKDFTHQLSLSSDSPSTTKIALSAYAGTTLFGPIFLTSSIYNFLIFSLLSTNQIDFFWSEWFAYALPTGICLLVFFSVGLNLFFKENEKPTPFRERIETQLKVLGKLGGREQGLCLLSIVYLVALMSRNYHGISIAYVSIIMFGILIIFDLITADELRKSLDWPALILFALLVGVVKSFNSLDLSMNFFPFAGFLDQIIKNDFALFTVILGFTLIFIRIFIPYGLTVVIAASLLLPFAQAQGVNPWLVGFLILLFSKESLIPAPSSNLKNFMMEFSENQDVGHLPLWRYHLMINLIKFAAVYFSISFWKDMSLI